MSSILLSIILMLLAGYTIVALSLYFMQPKFLYDPVKGIPYTPEELGLDYEDVVFRTGDRVQLHGWFIPASAKAGPALAKTLTDLSGVALAKSEAAPAPNADFTVLYCHGNGGNIMYYLDTVNILNSLGLNCFAFDYRGYGHSQGNPSEQGTYLDVRAAYRWLTKKKGIPPQRIIIFGWSLGATVAAYLAGKVRARGLVIEGAFTSYVDIGSKYYPYMPVRHFARFEYPTIDYIRKVKCPVMVIHSRDDETVPFEFGLQLYDAANGPKDFVELHGSHNDAFLVSSDMYKKAWLKWLQGLKESMRDENTRQKSV